MKNLIRCVYILIILLLICIIVLICNSKKKEDNQMDFYSSGFYTAPSETIKEGVIIPQNASSFFKQYKYTEITSKEIYETIDYFAKNIIPKYLKEVSNKTESEIKEYYENSDNLSNDLIEANNYNNYKKMVSEASKLDDNLVVKNIIIEPDSVTQEKDYISANVKFEFDNDIVLVFKMKVYEHSKENRKGLLFCV